MRKKEFVIVVFSMFLVIMLNTNISAVQCRVMELSECTGDWNILFKMSHETNAHAELESESNYNYGICCDFPSSGEPYRTCDPDRNTPIIKLSDSTNAHVQDPNRTDYPEEVCYQRLKCAIQTSGQCYGDDLEMFSISSETNAHVGSFDDYTTKVCCAYQGEVTPSFPETTARYWTDAEDKMISEIKVVPGETEVKMMLINGPVDTEVTFELKEKDTLLDDDIKEVTTYTDSNGNAEYKWRVTQEDTNNAGEENQYDFYFEVEGDSSYELAVQIIDCPAALTFCSDYEKEEYCNEDYCNAAQNFDQSCGESWTEGNCDYITECECKWDSSLGECYFENTTHVNCGGGPGSLIEGIGTCKIEDTSSGDCSGNDFVEYTWTASWIWDETNEFSESEIIASGWDINDFYNDGTTYHYDPLNQRDGCQGGSKTIPCPAAIQLPFFSASTLIGALVVLAVIYYIINQTNQKKGSSKKNSRTKKKKK